MRRRNVLRAGFTTLTLLLSPVTTAATQPAVTDQTEKGPAGPYEPLGRVDIEGARDVVVHHDGTVASVAAGNGFVSVDIEDPANPTVIAERRDIDTPGDNPFREVWDLWADGDRLVVAGPATAKFGIARGFALFDISDPADPVQITFHETDFDIHNVYFTDGTVYLTGSRIQPEPLVIVDISDDDPVERARWSPPDYDESWADVEPFLYPLHDVTVQDGVAYLSYWNAGTWLLDVSEPSDPRVVSTVEGYGPQELQELGTRDQVLATLSPPGNHHYATVNDDGTVLGIGIESWTVDLDGDTVGGPGSVELYDVSDESNPALLAEIEPPESFDQTVEGWFTTAHNFDIVGDRLYTAWYFGGVQIHDISDPANPELLAWWRDPMETSFWTAHRAASGIVATSSDPTGELGVDELKIPRPREALYVFPDRPGEQTDPPSLTEPPEGVVETDANGQTSQEEGSEEVETEEAVDERGPGFGPLSALAGVAGAGYAAVRRLGVDSTRE